MWMKHEAAKWPSDEDQIDLDRDYDDRGINPFDQDEGDESDEVWDQLRSQNNELIRLMFRTCCG